MFKKKSLTATSLGLRIVVGAYLLYLAYSLIPTIQKSPDTKELIFFIVMVTLFICVGGGAIIFSVKALMKGEYDKGIQKEENESETDGESENIVKDTTIDGSELREDSNIEDTMNNEEK